MHVLSTPPAFILSQDQTLVKSVCIQFRINQLANSSLFTVVLVCLKTVLKNLLLKKFSRVVVVYCSVIKVLCLCRSFQATAFIFYQKPLSLSRTFLFFFVTLFELSFAVSRDSLFRIAYSSRLVNSFLISFCNLLFSKFSSEYSHTHARIFMQNFLFFIRSASACHSLVSVSTSERMLSYHAFPELSMLFLYFAQFRIF